MHSFSLCLLVLLASCAHVQGDSLSYIGQTKPLLRPEVFAPGIISKSDEYEFGSVFNEDATEFFYGVDVGGRTEIRQTKLVGSTWSEPRVILSHEEYGFNDPFLSPDENRLYFISKRSLDGRGVKRDHDIWFVERRGEGWSAPLNAGPEINSDSNEYYISFTSTGTMYFASDRAGTGGEKGGFDIYSSKNVGGEFQAAIALSASVNTTHYEADVFVDPGEDYLIFCARRPGGLGKGDLYISFKNADGTWSESISMGDEINTPNHELCPFVSSDGKYLFYTSNEDIYWVSAKVIDALRGTR